MAQSSAAEAGAVSGVREAMQSVRRCPAAGRRPGLMPERRLISTTVR